MYHVCIGTYKRHAYLGHEQQHLPIFPNSVFIPVDDTTTKACPFVTLQPANTIFFLSYNSFSSKISKLSFFIDFDSPVNVDSFTSKLSEVIILASAET